MEGLEDSLQFYNFPELDSRKIASNNGIDRLNAEIRRRSRVVGVFPSTAIIKPDKYEPVLNAAMIELAEHYRTAIIPARVRTPRDNNVVEGTVGYASRQIIATVRNQKFFSLEEMNAVVWDLTDKVNATDFKKKAGSRELLFKEIEQKELLPLPPKPFQPFGRATATVAPDYHIEYDAGFNSVSPKFIKSEVSVKASSVKVFIYHKGKLHAEHPRCRFNLKSRVFISRRA